MSNAQTPHPSLKVLERLIGKWKVTGPTIDGYVTYRWLEGGFFMVQDVDFTQGDNIIKGLEYIGYDPTSNSLKSHYFGNSDGILEYAWEIEGDTLRIWFGEVGSAGCFTGQFSAEGDTNTGSWVWPGGGYDSTMTRVRN